MVRTVHKEDIRTVSGSGLEGAKVIASEPGTMAPNAASNVDFVVHVLVGDRPRTGFSPVRSSRCAALNRDCDEHCAQKRLVVVRWHGRLMERE